jgi:DNA-binding CsgD family transcriptional regulator
MKGTAVATSVSVKAPGLVGRGAELDFLTGCATAPPAAGPVVVLLQGPRGSGKTSLLDAAQGQLHGEGVTVLRSAAGRPSVPYGVVRDLFVPLGGAVDWARLPEGHAYAVMNGLLEQALALTALESLAVLIDDAPTADEQSLRWLDFLLRRSVRSALLVVLAQRPNAAGPGAELVADLAAGHAGVTLRLDPLSTRDIFVLAERAVADVPHGSFVDACARVSGGNPRLLRILLDELCARRVTPDESGAPLAAAVGQEVLTAQMADYLAGQPDHVRVVAGSLAVLDGVRTTALSTLSALPGPLVADALEILRREEMLTPDAGALRDAGFGSAVLATLPDAEVADLRRRAARLLDDQGERAERIAALLMALPDVRQPWMRRVLSQAAAETDDAGAASRYLARLVESDPDDADTVARLADLMAATDADAALSSLGWMIERTGDIRLRARLACRMGMAALTVRRASAAFAVLDQVLAELGAELGERPGRGDAVLLAQARSMLILVGLSDATTTAEVLGRCCQPEPSSGEPSSPGDLSTSALSAYAAMLAGKDATAVAEQARRGVTEDMAPSYCSSVTAANVLSWSGEPVEALAVLDRVQRGLPQDAGRVGRMAQVVRAGVLEGMGELAAAATAARAALPGAESEGLTKGTLAPRVRLASVLVKMRKPDQAGQLLQYCRRPHFGWWYPVAALTAAEAKRLQGETEGALEVLLDCGRRLTDAGVRNPVFAPWWLEAVCVLDELGRAQDGVELAEYGEQTARDWGTAEAAGLGLLARGVTTSGREGLDLLAHAVEVLAATPARLSHARAEYLFGKALLAMDDAKGARAHLRGAVDLTVRCGYLALGATARELLVVAGGRMRELSGRRSDVLSTAERRVAALAMAGASNRQIAETLFVTLRTVETHLSSIYRKLGVHLRTELPAALGARPFLEARP